MWKYHQNQRWIKTVLLSAAFVFCAVSAEGCTKKTDGNIMDGEDMIRKYQTISAEQAKEMMDTQEVTVLDVRTRQEYAEQHIPGAINIDVDSIGNFIPPQLEGVDHPILIYCRTGRRSKIAAEFLFDAGCNDLYDFGGIEDWPYETVSSDEEAGLSPSLILDAHEKSEVNGIGFEVTEYNDGILKAVLTNDSEEVFEYGAAYELKIKENGQWVTVPWKDAMNWIEIAYILSPGESQEITCDLSFCEKIESGHYQLIKGQLSTEFSLVYTE